MSDFWSYWIIVLTVVSFVLLTWILLANRKGEKRDGGEPGTTGHAADGIEELDNPLPAWWFNLFVLTLVFGVVYLLLMPGLGNFKGLLGWTSHKQWQEEVAAAERHHAAQFDNFLELEAAQLAADNDAMKMARRMFANNCSVCHGSDARGAFGFPDLTDNDWLYGGQPAQIRQSIAAGRKGAMPAWGKVLNERQLQVVADYVDSLRSQAVPDEEGAQVYGAYCAACHGADGSGNPVLGAPRLDDDIWLYGGSRGQVIQSVRNGRNGVMPAHAEQLSEAKIHLLTAYVLSLSDAGVPELAGVDSVKARDSLSGKAN